MCPFYQVRGRQAGGGRTRRLNEAAPAAAKISDGSFKRSNHVVYEALALESKAVRRKPSMYSTDGAARGISLQEFDAASAILSAHCDGLDTEDQLTCGGSAATSGALAHASDPATIRADRCRNNILRRDFP